MAYDKTKVISDINELDSETKKAVYYLLKSAKKET